MASVGVWDPPSIAFHAVLIPIAAADVADTDPLAVFRVAVLLRRGHLGRPLAAVHA